jgi:hypothetical protein
VIRCDEVVRGDDGGVVELRCSHAPDSLRGDAPADWAVAGAIHWVDAERSLPCRVRLYDRLFMVPDPDAEAAESGAEFTEFLNPESLVELKGARIEPSVRDDPPGSRYQFERLGYFMSDPEDSSGEALVFNRTVTLRDTWARQARGGGSAGAGRGAGGAPTAAGRRRGSRSCRLRSSGGCGRRRRRSGRRSWRRGVAGTRRSWAWTRRTRSC